MAYEFKRLGEVTAVETVTDETNVLIEEDGMIKKTARKNIGNVKSVNGVEPNEAGDVAFEYVKSVNGFGPDATGNVTMEIPASFSQVTYYIGSPDNPYLYVDSGATTKVTASDVSSLLAEGKNIFTIKLSGAPFEAIVYPISIIQMEGYFAFTLYLHILTDDYLVFYTAEYEEPVGPPT